MDEAYQRAVHLFDAGRYAEAANEAWQALQHAPDEGRLWQLYGTARWNLQDFDGARDALETASASVPLHPLAQYALAACYALTGQPDLAGVMYEHLAETVAATGMLAAVAVRLGALERYGPALHVCRRITVLDPAHHQAYFGAAFYLSRLGSPPQALIPYLAMALDLAPHILHYRLNLAFAWSNAGSHREAQELLEPIALENVRCPCWLRRMHQIFERAGDHARALVCQVRLSCVLQ